jgi:hypothetical protein
LKTKRASGKDVNKFVKEGKDWQNSGETLTVALSAWLFFWMVGGGEKANWLGLGQDRQYKWQARDGRYSSSFSFQHTRENVRMCDNHNRLLKVCPIKG